MQLIAANEYHKCEVKGTRDAAFYREITKVGFPPKTQQTKPFTDLILHKLPHSHEGMQHL